jgi:predicted dehydrogenase
LKLGIIGAESKHVEYFGILLNKERAFGNARIEYIWGGDTSADRLASCSYDAGIETIVNTPSEVINRSDAVLIVLRDGALHAEYAIECLKKHKPVFIDKPFTTKIKDTLSILKSAKVTGTPFTGGSTLCFLPEVPFLQELNKQTAYTEISYRADPLSPFGGWYYYGSHLTDLCSAICGPGAVYVEAKMTKNEVMADIFYFDPPDIHISEKIAKKKARIYSALDLTHPIVKMGDTYILSDNDCYFYGLKAFFETIATGNSPDGERLLLSTRIMDAIMRSAASGRAADIIYESLP